jgi:leader peptidase (prepilin peptidase) / N-methyltransferase
MSVHWLNSIARTPRGVPTFEDATVVVAAVATSAASIIAAPGLGGVAGAGLACLMVAIAAVDARRFIIPDEFSAAALALGLAEAEAAIRQPDAIGAALAGATLRAGVTAGLFFGLWAAYRRLRGRDGIGLGDVKLAGVAGAWLDWPSIPVAVEIAALAALAVCLVRWLGFGRTISETTRLPFGLFLAPAIWIAWLGERMAPQIFSVRGLG